MLIATLCIVQLGTGVLLDRRYDRAIVRYFPVSVYYPLVYWMLMAVVTAISTPRGLLGISNMGVPTRWRTKRE
jgi:biofilm PGA synthesis N-glycosyltransferase PgaC